MDLNDMLSEVQRLVLYYMARKGELGITSIHTHMDQRALFVTLYDILLQWKQLFFYKFCLFFQAYLSLLEDGVRVEYDFYHNHTIVHIERS